MTYILGIDGGNSKTLAMVGDETGAILGVGRAGGANHQGPGVEVALEEVRLAVDRALQCAGVPAEAVELAFYALAGADLDEDFVVLREALGRCSPVARWELDNDAIAALRSGTDNPDAVVVVVGAGTNCAGRNAEGMALRTAGLGWESGDWGGGGDMAEEAVRQSVRAADGRGIPTRLLEMVLDFFEVPDTDAMIHKLYRKEVPRSQFMDIARLVLEAANQGDHVAADIVTRQGAEAAALAIVMLRRLGLLAREADVVLAGSIFRTDTPLLLDTLADHIYAVAPDVRLVIPELEPAAGAVICGMDVLGIPVSHDTRKQLARTSRALLFPTTEE